jgi:hypothetical protein
VDGYEIKKIDFFEFFNLKQLNLYSNNQIHIQMVEFEFKLINQEMTPHYRPPAPVVDGSTGSSVRLSSNTDATVCSGQAVAPPPTHCATSARADSNTRDADDSASGAGVIAYVNKCVVS